MYEIDTSSSEVSDYLVLTKEEEEEMDMLISDTISRFFFPKKKRFTVVHESTFNVEEKKHKKNPNQKPKKRFTIVEDPDKSKYRRRNKVVMLDEKERMYNCWKSYNMKQNFEGTRFVLLGH